MKTTIIIARSRDPYSYRAGNVYVHQLGLEAPAGEAQVLLEMHLRRYPDSSIMGYSRDPAIWAMLGHVARRRGLDIHDLEGESCAVH